VYRLALAVIRAAKMPSQPWRSDPRKVKAFIALYEIVCDQMADCRSEDIRSETERLWDALSAQQRVQLASKPPALVRVVARLIKSGK
jgi:hypothetical protein